LYLRFGGRGIYVPNFCVIGCWYAKFEKVVEKIWGSLGAALKRRKPRLFICFFDKLLGRAFL
jgi:hypothetical protein